MIDHTETARQAFDASRLPDPPRTVADALGYIATLLTLLPDAERFGYVRGPAGGENVAQLPDGRGLVRVSRVMDRSGQIYKVLSDAPNGNPQWHAEDVQPDLYVPYLGPHTEGDEPDAPPAQHDLTPRVAQLEALFTEVISQLTILNRQNAGLDARAVDLETRVGKLENPPPAADQPSRPWWMGWT